ncbi:MAG: cation diffusion facilitator family transporter, partial [Gammaproteobacteria bacterium]|nr:cation diffusion facilitator family transporter [Gammaproteobacteria bacterium]
LNVQAAALHVLGDLLGSVAAIVSALAVLWFDWRYADPILALVVVAILVRGAWRVLRDAARILLEAVPQGVDINAVRSALTQIAGVVDVHHVHVWALTGDKPVLTLHALVAEDADEQSTVRRVKAVLRTSFGIDHSTVQVERGACPDASGAATVNPTAPTLDQ